MLPLLLLVLTSAPCPTSMHLGIVFGAAAAERTEKLS
jgi:hypothetical protein